MHYTLADVEHLADDAPGSFEIPAEDERRNLVAGDLVKLVFIPNPAPARRRRRRVERERMWAVVTDRPADGGFVGELVSSPFLIEANPGDVVVFNHSHVLEVVRGGA